ncbi:hypothetical protein Mgra_00006371, partial [Meloidogyne graminicola]
QHFGTDLLNKSQHFGTNLLLNKTEVDYYDDHENNIPNNFEELMNQTVIIEEVNFEEINNKSAKIQQTEEPEPEIIVEQIENIELYDEELHADDIIENIDNINLINVFSLDDIFINSKK